MSPRPSERFGPRMCSCLSACRTYYDCTIKWLPSCGGPYDLQEATVTELVLVAPAFVAALLSVVTPPVAVPAGLAWRASGISNDGRRDSAAILITGTVQNNDETFVDYLYRCNWGSTLGD